VEIVGDAVQPLPTPLVAGPGLGNRGMSSPEFGQDVGRASFSQPGLLLSDPRLKVGTALGIQATACLPELLGDVVPVDADLGQREVLLLAAPDVVTSVTEEHRPLTAIPSPVSVLEEPSKEGIVALKGCDQPFSDGPLHPLRSPAQRIDDAHEGHLGILALVPLSSSALGVHPPALSPTESGGSRGLSAGAWLDCVERVRWP
jgi:hypothetical protein